MEDLRVALKRRFKSGLDSIGRVHDNAANYEGNE